MSPTARTIACRCSTATASTRRSGTTCTGLARSIAAAARTRNFIIGELGPGMPVNTKHTNIGPRLTHRRQEGQDHRRAWAARHGPGQEPGKFLSPHGLAVDSKGEHLCRRGELHQLGRAPIPACRCRNTCARCRSSRRSTDAGRRAPAPDRQHPARLERGGVPHAVAGARPPSQPHSRRRDRRALALGLFPGPDAARPSRHGDRSDGAALSVRAMGRQGGARDRAGALQARRRSRQGRVRDRLRQGGRSPPTRSSSGCAMPARSPRARASRSRCRRRIRAATSMSAARRGRPISASTSARC